MSGMSKIVKTIASIAFPLTLIYGLYIIAHGHLTPGGGFQGGAVAASACAMVLVAYGSVWTLGRIKEKNLSILESLGALGFILLAFLGIGFGAVFFKNVFVGEFLFGYVPNQGSTIAVFNSGGVLPLMNFAVGLKVIAGSVSYTHLRAHET